MTKHDNLITLLRNRSIDEGETGGNSLCREAADALESAAHAITAATTPREVTTVEEQCKMPGLEFWVHCEAIECSNPHRTRKITAWVVIPSAEVAP